MHRIRHRLSVALSVVVLTIGAVLACKPAGPPGEQTPIGRFVGDTQLTGGLIVHLNCG